MQLHSLELHAFGAFARTVRIDFDAVGANGIFLLEGPTGVGKSTVIDAIVFALYGQLAGSASDLSRARSDFAEPTDPTYVDLVFETSSGIYRVRRTPQYERAKRRGTGTTLEQASVRLWRLDPGALDRLKGAGGGTDRGQNQDLAPGTSAPGWDHAVLDADGELLSRRLDEAGAEVHRAVGLSRAQLVQTIVLPQGEFASFMRAKPEERTKLLQQVFRTDTYVSAQAALEKQRAVAGSSVKELRSEAERALRRCAELTGVTLGALDEPDEEPHSGSESPVVAVTRLQQKAEEDAAKAQAEKERSHAAAQTAADERRVADEQVLLLERRESAVARQQQLAEKAPQITVLAKSLEAARRAQHVGRVVDQQHRAQEAAAAAAKRWSSARDVLDRLEPGLLEHVESPPTLREPGPAATGPADDAVGDSSSIDEVLTRRGDELVADTATMRELERRAHDLATRVTDLIDDESVLESHQRAAVRVREKLSALPADRRALETDKEQLESVARQQPAAVQALDAAKDQGKRISRLTTAVDTWRRACGVLTAADARCAAAIEEVARLQQERRRSVVGDLAVSLQEGEPCPVCGAREHPSPASSVEGGVPDGQVDAAEQARTFADEALRSARSEHDAARSLVHERSDLAGVAFADLAAEVSAGSADDQQDGPEADQGPTDATGGESRVLAEASATATAAISAAQAEVDRVTAAGARCEQVATKLRALTTTEQQLRDELATVDHQLTEVGSRLEAGLRAVTRERQQIMHELVALGDHVDYRVRWPGGEGSHPPATWTEDECVTDTQADFAAAVTTSFRELAARIAEHRAAVEACVAAHQRYEQAQRDVAGRTSELDDVLAAQGFESVDHVVAASLGDADIDRRSAELEEHQQAERGVKAELAVPEIAALPSEMTLEQARNRQERAGHVEQQAGARETEVGAEADEARTHARLVAAACQDVRDSVGAYQAQTRGAATMIRVADLVTAKSPDNAPRLTLSTYVLVRRFEQVVDAANERLRIVSDGRYELERSDEREKKGGRNLGLALRVLDNLTGARRETSSLSGGETFYVALCLALGLADVVSAEAGGVEFGTLFVDEGFGSLDAEKLEVVMTEISRLRDSGRTVGLVSHVEAMKQAVAERIEVRSTPGGSSTVRVVA